MTQRDKALKVLLQGPIPRRALNQMGINPRTQIEITSHPSVYKVEFPMHLYTKGWHSRITKFTPKIAALIMIEVGVQLYNSKDTDFETFFKAMNGLTKLYNAIKTQVTQDEQVTQGNL